MPSRILQHLVLLCTTALFIFVFRVPIENGFRVLIETYLPCRIPIAYSIGTFDKRFGISEADFLLAVREAEEVWEEPLGKELFMYEPKGDLVINLFYDERQATTVQLRELGLAVGDSRAAYDALKENYERLNAAYQQKKAAYTELAASFAARERAYTAEVSRLNAKGGAKSTDYARLNAEREALLLEVGRLRAMEAEINTDIAHINALVAELNRVAGVLNLHVGAYNKIGDTLEEEFSEGVYKSGPEGRSIDIYQYESRAKLVRVLAHELGHALGLEHLEDPDAIMYRLNESANETLTTADLTTLQLHCGVR